MAELRDSFRVVLERQDGFELTPYITSYESKCDFLSGAADSFTCTVFRDIEHIAELRDATYPLQRFVFLVNGQVQLRGQLDTQTIGDDGAITLTGSDYLANAVDSQVGRNLNLAAGDTVGSCIKRLMQSQQTIGVTNGWNAVRNHMAGVALFTDAPMKDFGAKTLGEPIEVDPKDGIWETCNGILARYGCLGKAGLNYGDFHLVAPEYRQAPAYSVTRIPGSVVNFRGTVSRDTSRFPTVFLAYGEIGRNTEPKKSERYEVDPFTDLFAECPDVQKFAGHFVTHEDAVGIDDPAQIDLDRQQVFRGGPNVFRGRYNYPPGGTIGNAIYREMRVEVPRKRAKNRAELESYANRMLSTAVKDSLVLHGEYIYGHSIDGVNITPDTVMKITDSIGGIFEDLWLASRTFKYDGNEQTTPFEAYRPVSISL